MSAVMHIEFMDKDEARRLTDQINAKSSDLWALLKDANERKAWAALGYKSWRDYAVKEFKVSQSRAYQLLDQSGVVTAIQEAANSTMVEISERAAREIKPFVKEVAQEIKEKVASGADPVTTTYQVIEAKRAESKPSKILPRPEPAAKIEPAAPEPVADDEDHGPSLSELVDELAEENKVLLALIESAQADDLKAEAIKWRKAYERAVVAQSEAMDSAARSEKREVFNKRQLMRCGKAVGEDDPRKIAAAVEAAVKPKTP